MGPRPRRRPNGPSSPAPRTGSRRRRPAAEALEGRLLLDAGIAEILPPTPPDAAEVNLLDPIGAVASGPDGNVWFTQVSVIGKVTPQGVVTEYPLPAGAAHDPKGITAGPDGNLWFTDAFHDQNAIGRITPAGVITMFPVDPKSSPDAIVAGPDGNLWFTMTQDLGGQDAIGRITPAGVVTEFPFAGNPNPAGIASGPDGNLWFVEVGTHQVGRITPDGVVTEFPVARPDPFAQLGAIAAGPDGNLWFSDGPDLGRITPAGAVTEFPVGPFSHVTGIAFAPDGRLWFTDTGLPASVGSMAPDGTIAEQPTPTASSHPQGIVAGPDGNLWFVETRFLPDPSAPAFGAYAGLIGQVILNPTGPAPVVSGVGTIDTVESWIQAGPDSFGPRHEVFSGTVATFTAADPNASPGDFEAQVDWGDGRSSPENATIVADGHGGFLVQAAHTYNDAGTFPIRVTVYDTIIGAGGTSAVATTTADVSEAPLTLQAVPAGATAGYPSVLVLASGRLDEGPGEFTDTVNWGDGSSSLGDAIVQHTITTDTGDFYTLEANGTHTYAAPGLYTVHVTIQEVGGGSTVVTTTVLVSAPTVPVNPPTPTPTPAPGPSVDPNPRGPVQPVPTPSQGPSVRPGPSVGDPGSAPSVGPGPSPTVLRLVDPATLERLLHPRTGTAHPIPSHPAGHHRPPHHRPPHHRPLTPPSHAHHRHGR